MDCALTVAVEDFRNNPFPDVVADEDVARLTDEPWTVVVDIFETSTGARFIMRLMSSPSCIWTSLVVLLKLELAVTAKQFSLGRDVT